MFGCFRSIGCLVVAIALGVAAWFTRDIWLPRVTGERPAASREWERASDDKRDHAQRVVQSLAAKSGPVFANLSAAEAAALVLGALRERSPAGIENAEAAIVGRSLTVRATVDVSQLRGLEFLGPLAGAIGTHPRVTLAGDIDVLGPGVAEFRVLDAKIGDVHVPQQIIPQLVSKLGSSRRPANAAPDALIFPVPLYVGDVRVGKGHVTLYKSVK